MQTDSLPPISRAPAVAAGPNLLALLGVKAGVAVEATVAAMLDATTARLLLPSGPLDVETPRPLVPGTTLQVAAEKYGQSLRLIVTDLAPPPMERGPARPSTPPLAPQAQGQQASVLTTGVPDVPISSVVAALLGLAGREVHAAAGGPKPVSPASAVLSSASPAPIQPAPPVAAAPAIDGEGSPRPEVARLAQAASAYGAPFGRQPGASLMPIATSGSMATPASSTQSQPSVAKAEASAPKVTPAEAAVAVRLPGVAITAPAVSIPLAADHAPAEVATPFLARAPAPEERTTSTFDSLMPTMPKPLSDAPDARSSSLISLESAMLRDAVRAMLLRQDRPTALHTDLEAALWLGAAVKPPTTVIEAIATLLGLRPSGRDLERPESLRSAIAASGFFMESHLASGAGAPAREDAKAALLGLKSALLGWASDLGVEPGIPAQPEGAARPDHHRPPARGQTPTPQLVATPSFVESAGAAEVVRSLLDRVEGALARLTLAQAASLAEIRSDPPTAATVEIPVRLGTQTIIVPFQFTQDYDPEGRVPGSPHKKPIWTVRFTLNAEPLGPVHASVRWRNGRVAVTLFVEREASAGRLEGARAELADAMAAGASALDAFTIAAGRPENRREKRAHMDVTG